jgi:hypothetical protein
VSLLASVVNGLLAHWLTRKIEAWWRRRHPAREQREAPP